MKRYRSVDILNKISDIKDLLTVCIISHGDIADKDSVMVVLQKFLEPALDEIVNMLEIEDDE